MIRGVELVTQYDRAQDQTFSNYAFDFSVLSMAAEFEEFDWSWISARRNPELTISKSDKLAPLSWRNWKKSGPRAIDSNRRRVSKLLTFSVGEQRPKPGSKQESTLRSICEFYRDRRHRFEALAAAVVEDYINSHGGKYRTGWITSPGSDGGSDFVGRLDVGSGFPTAKLIVLGQAKCEVPGKTTGGNHIARTVARLKRGWLGAYVTTGTFSEAVQREVIEDQYPILLIGGRYLAEQVELMIAEAGFRSVSNLLSKIDAEYDSLVQQRRPEELLLD